MKNIFTKAFLAVFCTVVLLTYSMEANAEDGHLHKAVTDYSSFRTTSGVYVDCGDNHRLDGTYDLVCKDCGSYMGQIGASIYESHYYTSYENAGHSDMAHDFIIRCGVCGHIQRIVIVCEYEKTGHHAAPW